MIKFFKFWSICVLWLSLCEVKIWSVIIQQHSTTRKKKKIAYFLFCWFLHQLISLSLQCYWRMLLRNKTVSWSLWSQSCRGHLHDIPLAFLSLFLISKRRCQFKFCDPPKLYTKQKLKYSCRLLKKLTTGRFLFQQTSELRFRELSYQTVLSHIGCFLSVNLLKLILVDLQSDFVVEHGPEVSQITLV